MSLSDISGIVAIILSIVAIWQSGSSERRSRENNKDTAKLLSEIKSKTDVLEALAGQSQAKLLDTVTSIANPKQPDVDEQMKMELAKGFLQNPTGLLDALKSIQELQEVAKQIGATSQLPPSP